MKWYFLFLLSILFIGCSDVGNNQTQHVNEPFTINRAASKATLAPVPINAKILLSISTDLNISSVNTANVFIKSDTNATISANLSYQQQVITIAPKVYLQPNTNYTIYVTTAVSSIQGEHLSKDANISFISAGALPDTTAPQYLGTNIGTTHHPKEIYYFQFDEAISPLSITDDMFVITDPDHNISVIAHVSGDLLIFTPQEVLLPGHFYSITLTLDSRIQDLSGNAMTPQAPVNLSLYETVYDPYPTIELISSSHTYPINGEVFCLNSSDNILFIGSDKGLTILEFNLTSTTLTLLSSLSNLRLGTVYNITMATNPQRLYLGSSNGFYIIDITTLTTPTIISHYFTPAPVYNLDVQDKNAYLAATIEGLIGLDISNEKNITLTFENNQASIVYDVLFANSRLYTSDYNRTIYAYNLDGTFSEKATAPMGAHLRNLAYSTDTQHLLIASGVQGINIIGDLISTLTISSQYRLPSYASNIDIFNNFAYTNLPGIGIFKFQSITYDSNLSRLLTPNPQIDIQAFTYLENMTLDKRHLILADKSGKIYSSKLP